MRNEHSAFGTRGTQVQILPLRPVFRKLPLRSGTNCGTVCRVESVILEVPIDFRSYPDRKSCTCHSDQLHQRLIGRGICAKMSTRQIARQKQTSPCFPFWRQLGADEATTLPRLGSMARISSPAQRLSRYLADSKMGSGNIRVRVLQGRDNEEICQDSIIGPYLAPGLVAH